MKHNYRRTFLGIALTLIAVSGIQAQAIAQDKFAAEQAGTIVGVWRTVVTPQNCLTGVPAPFTIRGLFTFHQGGTMSEWGVAPGSSPALRSPGHGVWQRELGWQDYSFKFTHYLYDATGAYTGRQKIVGNLIYDDDRDGFNTTSRVEVLNVSETVVATFCATAVGVRLD